MHVTACLAGQKVDVEVEENCRTLQALKEAIVKELPQLCVEWFDVSVGGRALDGDEGIVSLVEHASLDVVPNTRGLGVLALREAGRDVNERGLLQAAEQGDVTLCTLYLDAGVPVDCADEGGFTSLHVSCLNGHLLVTTLLLDRGCTTSDEKSGDGWTPLHHACREGELEMARLLLDRGSTAIDEKNGDGWTPLHLSCRYGDSEIARLLLDRGCTTIDAKNGDGWTPLAISCREGDLETAKLLLDRGSTVIDEKDGDGWTPLHLSCRYGHLSLVSLLLDRGSTAIDEKTGYGERPLQVSCRYGNVPLVTLLLDRGCSVDVEACRAAAPTRQVLELLSDIDHAESGGPHSADVGR